MKTCKVCGRDETQVELKFCGTCGVYICTECEGNYPKRAVAAARLHLNHILDLVEKVVSPSA